MALMMYCVKVIGYCTPSNTTGRRGKNLVVTWFIIIIIINIIIIII
jgi:hypothetical protein